MSEDLSNEEISEMWLECGKDIHKFARLVIAHTERRNMHAGLITNTHSQQYNEGVYQTQGE